MYIKKDSVPKSSYERKINNELIQKPILFSKISKVSELFQDLKLN
jgi:hypothetical protein